MDDGAARWRVLALLFTVRTTMAFQFQAVGALSPLFVDAFAVSLADIGLLIGLYSAPGIVFALPGGALAARFGDREIVIGGLALMVAGGVITVLGETFGAQVAGRLVAGAGGVILNVVMSKMVADWFSGREIGTAMAIFVNSWPVGIAVGLVVLPAVAQTGGLSAGLAATTALAGVGLVLMAGLYRAPPRISGPARAAAWPRGPALAAALVAGAIWGLLNAALVVVFGFGPALLTERGMTLISASAATSVVLWLLAAVIPFGGVIADRTGRRDLVMVVGLAGFAAGLLGVRFGFMPVASLAAVGVMAALPVGPILSLPAAALSASTRAAGMGLFFTVYYVIFVSAPWLAGLFATAAGSAAATFEAGAAMLGACIVLLGVCRALLAQASKAQAMA